MSFEVNESMKIGTKILVVALLVTVASAAAQDGMFYFDGPFFGSGPDPATL